MIFDNLQILKKYIISYKIKEFEQIELNLRLKIEINFIDDSILYIREIIIDGKKENIHIIGKMKMEN